MLRRYTSWDARVADGLRRYRHLRVNFESSLAMGAITSAGHGGYPPWPRPPHVTSEIPIVPANGESRVRETDRVSNGRVFGIHEPSAADGALRAFEEISRSIQHRFARCRKRDGAAVANEKCRADVMLEALDHAAERRLGHDEALRGAPEVELLRNDDESVQPAQIGDHRSPHHGALGASAR